MSEAAVDRAHNDPPEPVDEMEDRYSELLAGLERMPETIEDDDTAKRATTLARQIGALSKQIDDRRKAEVEPHLSAQRTVNGRWNPLIDGLKAAKRKVEGRIGAFDRAKREAAEKARREAEGAARKAAATNAPQPVPETPPAPVDTRDDFGSVASKRTETKFAIENFTMALGHCRTTAESELRETVEKIVGRQVRAKLTDIPGVRIYTEERTVVR